MFLVLAFASVPFSYDGSLQSGQTLRIANINGNVQVRTGDRLTIHAEKHSDRGDPNDVAIRVDKTPTGLVVCVRYQPNPSRGCDEHGSDDSNSNSDTQVDFEIAVPRGLNVDANTVNGSVDVENAGPTEAGTVNGRVRVLGDARKASTVNGSVVVQLADRARGRLSARTVNGSVEISLPAGSGVELSAKTLNGDIHADGFSVDHARYGPGTWANGTIGDGALHIKAETLNGSITLNH